MADELNDFREQYPMYAHFSDEELAEKIRTQFYPDMDPVAYRERLGLPPPPEPEKPPTIGERINSALFDRGKKVDPLTVPDEDVERFYDPDGFEVDVNRPIINNYDGTESSEKTIGVEMDGRHYNIPSIVAGKVVTQDEAVADAQAKMAEGWIFPNYDSQEEADAAAPRRSDSLREIREAATQADTPTRDGSGLTETQFGAIKDWLSPPAGRELMAGLQADQAATPKPKPVEGNPLLDQFYAGWDKLMEGHNTMQALELGAEIGMRGRGEKPKRDVVGKAGRAARWAHEFQIAQDPQAYAESLVDDLQGVLDTRAARRQRSQSVQFSTATEKTLASSEFFGRDYWVDRDTWDEVDPDEPGFDESKSMRVSSRGALSELADHPITIISELFMRSGANMAETIPLAIAGGAAAGPWGFAGGLGVGSGMVEYRARLTEFIERAGYDLNKAEDVLAIANNAELLKEFSQQAGIEAGIIAATDVASGRIAGINLVPPQVRNAVARGITNVVAQTGVQMVGGGAGELGAQAWRGEGIHAGQITAEAVAEAGTAVFDVTAATMYGAGVMKAERDIANAIANVYDKLDPNLELEGDVATPQDDELPGTDVALADNEVEINGTRYTFTIDREIPTDGGTAYDLTIDMGNDNQVAATLKAGETIEDLILELLPHYAAAPLGADDFPLTQEEIDIFDFEDIHQKTHSSMKISSDNKIKKPVALGGRLFVNTGGTFKGEQRTYSMTEVIAADEYTGERSKKINPETGYQGIAVTYRGKEYVLGRTYEVEQTASKQLRQQELEGEILERDPVGIFHDLQDRIDAHIAADNPEAAARLEIEQMELRDEIEAQGIDFDTLGKGGDQAQEIRARRDEDRTLEGDVLEPEPEPSSIDDDEVHELWKDDMLFHEDLLKKAQAAFETDPTPENARKVEELQQYIADRQDDLKGTKYEDIAGELDHADTWDEISYGERQKFIDAADIANDVDQVDQWEDLSPEHRAALAQAIDAETTTLDQDTIENLTGKELISAIAKQRQVVIDIFADESVTSDDRNVALMDFNNLIRRARLDIEKLSPDLQEQAREALDTIAKLPERKAVPEPPGPDPTISYHDARLKREGFRAHLSVMASELQVGGGAMGTLKREESYPGEMAETGQATGEVITRMPSENPAWFQEMVATPEIKLSVEEVQNAVNKAIAGAHLGVRQQRAIGWMLDDITEGRRTEIDYARDQLDKARERRRMARQNINLDPAENETESGEEFEESEYDADMTADSRIIYELMEKATQAGIDEDVLEGLSMEMQDATDSQFIQALEELINEHESQAGAQEVAPQPSITEEPGAPRNPDLAVTADSFEQTFQPATIPSAVIEQIIGMADTKIADYLAAQAKERGFSRMFSTVDLEYDEHERHSVDARLVDGKVEFRIDGNKATKTAANKLLRSAIAFISPTPRNAKLKPKPKKRPKLTPIQADALEKAKSLGATFSVENFMRQRQLGSGKPSTSGQVTAPEDSKGTINVNTVRGLMDKGYLEATNPDADFFDQMLRVIDDAQVKEEDAVYELAISNYIAEPNHQGPPGDPGTQAAKLAAALALEDLRGAGTVFSRALSGDLSQNLRTDLVGNVMATPQDLAILAQIYRDPRFETLRVFFTADDDLVIAQVGLTTRMPDGVPAVVGPSIDAYLFKLWETAKGLGATGYWMQHNHPSGISMPSNADEKVTIAYNKGMPGMRGHVVIDHNEWSEISPQGVSKRHEQDMGAEDFEPKGGASGRRISSPTDAAGLALSMSLTDDDVVLIVLSNRHIVRNVTSVPAAAITDNEGRNRRLLLKATLADAGARVIAVGRDPDILHQLRNITLDGLLVNDDNTVTSQVEIFKAPVGEDLFPRRHLPRVSPDTSEPFDYLRQISIDDRLAPQGMMFVQEGQGDMFGDTTKEQAIADEIRKRDKKRNEGQDNIETGDPGDLFSQARQQVDLEDIAAPPSGLRVRYGDQEFRVASLEEAQQKWDQFRRESGAGASELGRAEIVDDNGDLVARIAYNGRLMFENQVSEPDDELTDTGYFEQYGERRVDTERRINYSRLPTEELIRILYTDELTGIANRRAFQEEGEDHPFLASIDADSMKFINDNLGHDAGDALLKAVAQALDQTDVTAYHISGDEFYLGADTRAELTAAITLAKATLSTGTLKSDRGSKRGIEITYGIGTNKADADQAMEMQKKDREASGKRQPSGSPVAPRGFSLRIPLEPPVDATAGTNYVGMIGRHGDLPVDANHNYVLGDGRKVKIPKKPIYRAQIISELQRRFGRKIYFGRVKGKTRLGFYRAGIGEIRIKEHNDLEVTAHEVAHWFDDRYPWIRTLYRNYRAEMLGVSYDDEMIWEGYAEFMRLWFTQDYKAIQAAPSFYDAFMTALEEHSKEGDAMKHLQELMHAWHLQGARARAASKQGLGKEQITDRFRRMFEDLPDKMLQRTFDNIRQFKQVERAIRGGVAGPAFSGYSALRMTKGLHGMMLAIAHKGTIAWNAQGDIEFVGKSLNAIFDQVKGNLEHFIQYMIGRRAQELASQQRENLYRPDEIAAMLSYAGEEGNEHFSTVFDEWLQFNTEMMEFYRQSGLMDDATLAYISEMNKNYVPFNRIADTLMEHGKVSRGGGPFVRLKGGTQNINDVMESIIGNTSHLVHMSLVNVGKRNFYNMILASQGNIRKKERTSGNTLAGNYAAPIPKDAAPVFIQQEQVLKAVLEGMGLTMAWYRMASQGMVNDETELAVVAVIDQMLGGMEQMVMFFQTGRDPQGNVDFFFDNGEKRFFEIIDPLLYEAIGQLGPQSHNLAVSILGGFANVLRRGVVLTPTFQIKNFIRDTGNAFTLSKGKIMPIKDALVALMERVYNDEHYWLYMANGGGFASIAEAEGIASDRILDTPEKLFSAYDRMISTFEYANRIAEFKVLMRKGMTAREAALAGREISSDFAMHGSSPAVRVFTIAVPFLNARMQGIYRNARELAHLPPGERLGFAGKRAFAYALRSLMTVTIPTLYLYAMNKDDERYKEIPDWIRDLNWIIFTGSGEDDYVMIPKPFETGMLWGTVPERALEYYYKRDEKELADAMLWMAMQTFALDLTPQAFQPWQELLTNRKFTGAPVIPEYLESVLPQEQWRYYTSDAMIALGRKFNISPMKAEHLVRGHFGTLGAWALGAADYAVGDLSTGGKRPSWDTWRENIITSPFVNKGPLRRTKSEDDLYELLQETREISTAMSQMHRRNPQFIEGFLDDEAERQTYLALNAALEDSAKKMGELKRAMDIVAGDPNMDPDVKRKTIDEIQRAKNKVAHGTRQAIDPEMVRDLIDDIQRKLDQERLDQELGIAANAQ